MRYAKEELVELLRERLEEFEGTIGEIRDGMPADSEVVYSPLSEVLLPTPWHKGRVVLGGDAAHACVPHLNQGAAMAIEDAATLADELVAGDDGRGGACRLLGAPLPAGQVRPESLARRARRGAARSTPATSRRASRRWPPTCRRRRAKSTKSSTRPPRRRREEEERCRGSTPTAT